MTLDELDAKLKPIKVSVGSIRPPGSVTLLEKCPFCGSSLMSVSASKEVEYAPPFHVRGHQLPKMTRHTTMITCSTCEYAEEA